MSFYLATVFGMVFALYGVWCDARRRVAPRAGAWVETRIVDRGGVAVTSFILGVVDGVSALINLPIVVVGLVMLWRLQ